MVFCWGERDEARSVRHILRKKLSLRSRCPLISAEIMKKLLQIIGWLFAIGVVLLVGAMLYSTAKGYMTWYFRVDGQVMVDGHKTGGYMHANTQKTILLVTRTDGVKLETYLVSIEHGKGIISCGGWHPIRFLPTPVGDLNPPCSGFSVEPERVADAPVPATLVLERRSVSFSTISGRKVKAEW